MKNKKTIILSIVAIIALIGITIGVSLAFFNYAKTGTTDNTLETGNITFIYTETSTVGRGINITDAFPISDEEGKILSGEGNVFDFNISSTKVGKTKINYEITARKENSSTLSENLVRMYLTKVNGINEEEVLLENYDNLAQTTNNSEYVEKVLYQGSIYADDDNYDQDFRLRMWVANNEEYTQEDMGKTFTVTVNVYSSATISTEVEIALENNTNIINVEVNDTALSQVTDKDWNYEIDVEGDTTQTTINIETENPNAKVEIKNITDMFALGETSNIKRLSTTKTLDLIRGDNYFEIIVTSENGKVEDDYVIKITLNKYVVSGESILKILESDKLENGYYTFKVNNESYKVHLYILEGNQTITTNTTYGNASDCASGTAEEQMAKNMVIVKVKGDYTVNSGVTVGPYYNTTYGGPKGFMLYVTGKLTNNGTIDNSHGAYAYGQDVYLWKNTDGTYEYIPAVGALGGTPTSPAGQSGVNRQLGGGGGIGSNGGNASSYSGGAGGAADYEPSSDGSSIGGAGGNSGSFQLEAASGGAGNPGGNGFYAGTNGTGGLLIIYSKEYENKGTISANGYSTRVTNRHNGGSSGGGSINIFTNQKTGVNQLGIETTEKYNSILGTTSAIGGTIGGVGGSGSISIGEIRNGQYYDLKNIIEQDKETYKNTVTKTGESLISLIKDDTLKTGYYYFKVKNEEYPVHLIVLEGNQTITANTQYGDAKDVATGTTEEQMAKNMVIVKVKGDYTVNSGVTVGPYYNTTYGGPKGFMLYVTGKLTNNGTIDNSHGAYAYGQDVYLWKNTDGTYEYIPAVGALGGTPTSPAGQSGVNRQLGGGGGIGSNGGNASSYSGGAGGAADYEPSSDGSSIGGAGGNSGSFQLEAASGGAGNPGGNGFYAGTNGTGGLLIIYSKEYENKGTISANGYSTRVTNRHNGGSSGGGSINVFYNTLNSKGTTSVIGGTIGGTGGNGTVTYTQIN